MNPNSVYFLDKQAMGKAREIFRRTRQAVDREEKPVLSASDLMLVELAVTGGLSERGMEQFELLFQAVSGGNYHPPYLWGLRDLAMDNIGRVFYKGIEVETATRPWAYSAAAHYAFSDLRDKCRYLEEWGVTPSLEELGDWEKKHATRFEQLRVEKIIRGIHPGKSLRFSRVVRYGREGYEREHFLPGFVSESEVDHSDWKESLCLTEPVFRKGKTGIEYYTLGDGENQRDATEAELLDIRMCFRRLLPRLVLEPREFTRRFERLFDNSNNATTALWVQHMRSLTWGMGEDFDAWLDTLYNTFESLFREYGGTVTNVLYSSIWYLRLPVRELKEAAAFLKEGGDLEEYRQQRGQ